ncbi:hypothetical protein DFH11DRAFT_1549781 [Phellopilus nigrolimitatus]|nr:hypothetical protein DFH11DRAFT_1549781 [Phellopilus nigrolimitatus]
MKWDKEAERKGIDEELEEWSEERNIRKLNDNSSWDNIESKHSEKVECENEKIKEQKGYGNKESRKEKDTKGVRREKKFNWPNRLGLKFGVYGRPSGVDGRPPKPEKNGDDRESLRSRFDQRKTGERGESPDRRGKQNHKLQIGREGDGRRARALSGRSPVGSKSVQRFRTEPSRSTSSRIGRHAERVPDDPRREAVKKLQKQERLQEEDFNNQAKKLAVRLRSGAFCTRGGVQREPIGVASRVGEPGTRFGERGHIFDSRYSQLDLNLAHACGAFYSCPGYGPNPALGPSLIASPDVTWPKEGDPCRTEGSDEGDPSRTSPEERRTRGLNQTERNPAERRGSESHESRGTKDEQFEPNGEATSPDERRTSDSDRMERIPARRRGFEPKLLNEEGSSRTKSRGMKDKGFEGRSRCPEVWFVSQVRLAEE